MVYDELNIYFSSYRKLKFGKSQNRILIYDMFNQPFLILVKKDKAIHESQKDPLAPSWMTLLIIYYAYCMLLLLAFNYMMSEHLAGG